MFSLFLFTVFWLIDKKLQEVFCTYKCIYCYQMYLCMSSELVFLLLNKITLLNI